MDLFAYSQIEELGIIASKNKIYIPRLRGYRLMSSEKPFSPEKIDETVNKMLCEIYDRAIKSNPIFRPDSPYSRYSPATERLAKKYLIHNEEGCVTGIRMDLIHGKNRKAIKFACKKAVNAVRKNLETFNKYVGCDDVLYIHARIGGYNWLSYGGSDIEKQPWFLEKADDYFDDTYCDIYAKIGVNSEDVI